MVEGILANIQPGETFIVWDDDDTPGGDHHHQSLRQARAVDRAGAGRAGAVRPQGHRGPRPQWPRSRSRAAGLGRHPGRRRRRRLAGVDVWTTNERLQHYDLRQGFTYLRTVVLPHNPSGALFQRQFNGYRRHVFKTLRNSTTPGSAMTTWSSRCCTPTVPARPGRCWSPSGSAVTRSARRLSPAWATPGRTRPPTPPSHRLPSSSWSGPVSRRPRSPTPRSASEHVLLAPISRGHFPTGWVARSGITADAVRQRLVDATEDVVLPERAPLEPPPPSQAPLGARTRPGP